MAQNFIFNAIFVLLSVVVAKASYTVAKNIQYQADHDDLTGLFSRRKYVESLQGLIKSTDVSKHEKLALMSLDLNGFKLINDSMGHAVGDELLSQVSKRLTHATSSDMILARMGGDEFSVACAISESQSARGIATTLKQSFNKPFDVEGTLINMDSSVGYSVYPDDAVSYEQLQITSDFAMFRAKQKNAKCVQVYDSLLAIEFEKRLVVERDLKKAIENDELELYYQPQYNLALNSINSVEALIRWQHPKLRRIMPGDFIEIAEKCGLMPAIGNWVLDASCRQSAIWNEGDNAFIRAAVNVSVHQFMQVGFVDLVKKTLERYDLNPEYIELEVTESVVMADLDMIVKSLVELKSLGLKIALDDFGTGYSSLSKIHNLPLDSLKIDRSIISKLDNGESVMQSMSATIKSIATIYDLETVAEGIETIEQLEIIRSLGIDVAQGYLYSKPLQKDDVVSVIQNINKELSTPQVGSADGGQSKAA